jgi:hypothetical protein
MVKERERARPLRVRGRVQHRHRATVVRAEDDSLGGADGVEDGAHVLHPRFERGELPVAVGEARTALVKQDEPEIAREALVEAAPVRRLPAVDEVGTEVRNEHEIGVGVADHLIGDRRSAALGIADIRLHIRPVSRTAAVATRGAGSTAGPPRSRDRLSPPSGPSLRSRKRRTDVPLQAPTAGRPARRPDHVPEQPSGRRACSAFVTTTRISRWRWP